jgi:hypothetical protein
VITVPDGWPIWTSGVRPGREHDTTAVRAHTEILPTLTDAADDLRTLGDLGYEGESDTITVAFKRPKDGRLTLLQQQLNKAHNSVRAIGERGNSLLKMTLKAPPPTGRSYRKHFGPPAPAYSTSCSFTGSTASPAGCVT